MLLDIYRSYSPAEHFGGHPAYSVVCWCLHFTGWEGCRFRVSVLCVALVYVMFYVAVVSVFVVCCSSQRAVSVVSVLLYVTLCFCSQCFSSQCAVSVVSVLLYVTLCFCSQCFSSQCAVSVVSVLLYVTLCFCSQCFSSQCAVSVVSVLLYVTLCFCSQCFSNQCVAVVSLLYQ